MSKDNGSYQFTELKKHPNRPKIVCLCGSTRFMKAFHEANLKLTIEGNIVLSIGCNTASDADLFDQLDESERKELKARLDELHKRKIDLADEVLVLNVGGYVGESTHNEIVYAMQLGKRIRFLEPNFIFQIPESDHPHGCDCVNCKYV